MIVTLELQHAHIIAHVYVNAHVAEFLLYLLRQRLSFLTVAAGLMCKHGESECEPSELGKLVASLKFLFIKTGVTTCDLLQNILEQHVRSLLVVDCFG